MLKAVPYANALTVAGAAPLEQHFSRAPLAHAAHAGLFPDDVSARLTTANLNLVYGPLDALLTSRVAPRVPATVTPNLVTAASTLLLLPVLGLCARGHYGVAALLVFVHDMLVTHICG